MKKKIRCHLYLKTVVISGCCLLASCGTDDIVGENTTKEPGGLESDFTLNPEWGNGDAGEDDRTNGENGQYYYNYILESTFNPQVQTPEMAIAGNILYVPTGTYGQRPTDIRNVSVEYWNLTTGQKIGTLPMPEGMTSFTYLVHALFRLENLLFVGHGENILVNRLEVYDISDPSHPKHVTYVGGEFSYFPNNPDNRRIGIPYAAWGKDGKLLLLDNFKLSVYDVSSLTAENAGTITPVKFMPIHSASGDEPEDQAAFVMLSDGSLYLTDPSRQNPKGLRKIAWKNVISSTSGQVDNLIDETDVRLPGMAIKKAVALDDNLLVFSNNITNNYYFLNYFKVGQNSGTDCTAFFKPSAQQPGNALLLDSPSDGKRRIVISQGNGSIAVYQIEKIYLSDF